MEKDESLVKLASRQATLEVWVEINGAIMALGSARCKELYQTIIDGLYHLKGREFRTRPGPMTLVLGKIGA